MKNRMTSIALTAAALLLTASMAFAIEVKTPDFKGAAKANVDGAKAAADKNKADAKGAADKAKADAKAKIVDINSASKPN